VTRLCRECVRSVSRERGVFQIAPETARLEALCARYGLSERQRGQLAAILRVLVADGHAPTAVRDPVRAADVHLADSLAALELDVLQGAEKLADLGAGAGFPGLALAVALPQSEVTLVEAQARKCAFIKGLCLSAGIANAGVVNARAEEWLEGVGANDVVTARAVAAAAVVVEYAAPLLKVGGHLIEWRGRRDGAEERSAALAGEQLGLERVEVRRVEPYAAARDHHLHVHLKVRETPAGFPRRAGVARKRPLAR
jgi:16S rRNA (guanine527-N7)-methyltransferase